ncbi:acyl transferase domain-containing protein [Tumebacillus sp. BK434]|uniref:type I polyketide synthase n=1 Tax=Tumebacillus sp. BK434 TaxID=2512169 RepID=UPI00104B5B00|nr:type I polyketide synthase [Tumebacillus sp. BK434]TCP54486.1 acyl transferase domain-containing protein [Tumebacillus sp. BK434]
MSEMLDLQGIAIIGMSGRFPGAKNTREFWENLKNGVESIRPFSDEEVEAGSIDREDPNYVQAGAPLEGAEEFDAAFFDMIKREAETTDPQHRLFLECAYEALEDSGYEGRSYDGRIAVFGGVGRNTYMQNLLSNPDIVGAVGSYQAGIGNDHDFLATRISYKLNLQGPAVTVQTACSTSLVAVHMACQSLLTYESDMALAGGVAVKFPQKAGYLWQEGGIFSPDGHCRAFDENSAGMVVGNGGGVVLLKRLEDAIEDGDEIYAVIRASAINNDGSNKVGYTAPSVDRQEAVISQAIAIADIDPATITYVEAHGTGTALGDPIEVSALTQAFRMSTEEKGYCALGSVKTNVGHLDAAAGVTGLIKTVLSLQHKQLPPSLHFENPNPKIDFANSPFYVNAKLRDWNVPGDTPRRAGVSSFGIGGTNAHVILEEAPALAASDKATERNLLVLSAKTVTALEAMTENLAAHLEANAELNLSDVAYTLQTGRAAYNHRRIVVATHSADAVQALRALDPKQVQSHSLPTSHTPSVAFLFSGQGSQYANMGRGLYETEAVFKAEIDRGAQILKPHLGLDLRDLFFPVAGMEEEAQALLNQTQYTQPSLFVFEYALAQLWLSRGVQPEAMIGHSIGEYVAAVLAGVMSVDEALPLVAARGRLMQAMEPGSMLAIPLPEAEVAELLPSELSIAGVNGPKATVVAGPTAAIEKLEGELQQQELHFKRLDTSHAFHSAMMEPMLKQYAAEVAKVELHAPVLPYLSNVSGTWITAEEATDPGYYVRHLRQAVRFGDNVAELVKQPGRILLEVGPGRSLGTVVKQSLQGTEAEAAVLSTTRHRDEAQTDEAFFLTALGQLWLHGVEADLSSLHEGASRRRLHLPTYPFEKQRYFVEFNKNAFHAPRPAGRLHNVADWFHIPAWQQTAPLQAKQGEAAHFLLLQDETGVGAALADRLKQQGHDVTLVRCGQEFAKGDDGVYTLNPAVRGEYSQLWKELAESEQVPTRLVHLWSLTDGEQSEADAKERGFYALIHFVQALGEQNRTESFQVTVITNSLQQVTSEPILAPERATVLGAVKVIPQEFANITARAIDIELAKAGKLTDRLAAELAQAPSGDTLVAYRGAHRFVQGFDDVQLAEVEAAEVTLRQNGVYLITGATGEIGLHVAEHLAQEYAAKLVLLGSQDFPASENWQDYIAAQADADSSDLTGQAIARLLELGKSAELIYQSVDLTDAAALGAVLAEARERFGVVHGVFHTAELMGSGLIQLKTQEAMETVFAPKVTGTLALAAATRGMELDFFALFSRMLSVTGGFGQVDNTAANAFLGTFARAHSTATGTHTLAIDWGMWQFDNLLQGQPILPEMVAQLQQMQKQFGISAADGMDAFTRILASGLNQVIVSTQHLQTVIDDTNGMNAATYFDSLKGSRTIDANRPYVAPRNDVEEQVAVIWQDLFGVDLVSIHDNFFDLGGNSLLGVQLVTRIRNTFEIDLPMSALFESANVAELSQYIADHQLKPEELDELEALLAEIEGLSEDDIEAELFAGEGME